MIIIKLYNSLLHKEFTQYSYTLNSARKTAKYLLGKKDIMYVKIYDNKGRELSIW